MVEKTGTSAARALLLVTWLLLACAAWTVADDTSCSCEGLTGSSRDRCALWHIYSRLSGLKVEGFSRDCRTYIAGGESHCNANGDLQCENGRVVLFKVVRAGGSSLSGGELAPEVAYMDELKQLRLPDVQLTGSLPLEWGQLEKLEYLYLNGNGLTGPIPPEWGNMKRLKHLELSKNQLSGPLPAELGNLTELTQLTLNDNQISGDIPPEWGNMTSLVYMKLHYNELDGHLPPDLGRLAKLEQLILNNNRLTGGVPAPWRGMKSLKAMHLHSNDLDGTLPAGLSELVSLAYTYQALPEGSKYRGLYYLEMRLHDNPRLHGTIPRDWFRLKFEDRDVRERACQVNSTCALVVDLRNTSVSRTWTMSVKVWEFDKMRDRDEVCSANFFLEVWVPNKDGLPSPYKMATNPAHEHNICGNADDVWYTIAAWSVFGFLLSLIIGYNAVKACPCFKHKNTSATSSSRYCGVDLAVLKWRIKPFLFVLLTVVDVASDILMVVQLFLSNLRGFACLVLLGLFLPEVLSGFALYHHFHNRHMVRVRASRSSQQCPPVRSKAHTYRKVAGKGTGLFLGVVTCTFLAPVFVAGLSITAIFGKRVFYGVSFEKFAEFHSGATACTEDLFSSVFSTLAFVKLSREGGLPVYVSPVSFYFSLCSSMVHMLMSFWDAAGYVREEGNLRWVWRAFLDLKPSEDPEAKLDLSGLESMEGPVTEQRQGYWGPPEVGPQLSRAIVPQGSERLQMPLAVQMGPPQSWSAMFERGQWSYLAHMDSIETNYSHVRGAGSTRQSGGLISRQPSLCPLDKDLDVLDNWPRQVTTSFHSNEGEGVPRSPLDSKSPLKTGRAPLHWRSSGGALSEEVATSSTNPVSSVTAPGTPPVQGRSSINGISETVLQFPQRSPRASIMSISSASDDELAQELLFRGLESWELGPQGKKISGIVFAAREQYQKKKNSQEANVEEDGDEEAQFRAWESEVNKATSFGSMPGGRKGPDSPA